MANDDSNENNYFYNANVPAAYLFAVLFGIVTVVHHWLQFRYRTFFMIVLLVGLWMEFVGYITRVVSIKDPEPLAPIIISQVGLVVAPAFMAAQSYMIVGRIMAYVGSSYSYIGHGKITKVFVGADVFAILTQAGGGAILGSARGDIDKMKTAKSILLGGLALQVITFGIFLFVAVAFDVRTSRAAALKPFAQEMKHLRPLWTVFYLSGILITGRSIYRTIEFGSVNFTPGEDDPQGYAVTHEWLFYVFDSIPIWFTCILFAICHPGRYLPSKKGRRIDGSLEEQPGSRRFICCGPRKPASASSSVQMNQYPVDPHQYGKP